MEGRRKVCHYCAPSVRSVAGPAGTLPHLHEQLHRADLAGRCDGSRTEEGDGHVREVSTAQNAELRLHGPDHAIRLRAVPAHPGPAQGTGCDRWDRRTVSAPGRAWGCLAV